MVLHTLEQPETLLHSLQQHTSLISRLRLLLVCPPLGEDLAIAFIRAGVADIVHEHKLEQLSEALSRLHSDVVQELAWQQEEQGKLTYHQLRNLLRMTPVGVFRCDAEKNCIYVNDRFCQITGLSPEEAMGTGWQKALHPEDAPLLVRDWYDKKGVVEEVKTIYRYQKPATGELAWVIGQSISETDRKGNVVGYLGSITDITRLKEAEEALREKNKSLSKTKQELDSFVYSASHNLRAPLTSMMGLINLIRMDARKPEALDRLCMMMDHSLQRLDGFIRDIVDHSRNVHLSLQVVKTDPEALLQEVLDEFAHQDTFGDIEVSLQLRKDAPFFTDPTRLRIVLRNLISNCIRYKNIARQPRIWLEGEIGPKEASFYIRDNGTGIREEHQPKVFDMFYRADEYRSGSGLGLYIAREVVERMGGSISLSSAQGKGTSVQLQLPNTPAAS
ncbi:PAS domain-containing sensor histidine kinase [Cesiribacter andamanensis]|uniref:histidine kinase n=1 Tax=Cesiribacter andamanensis AMV16 TaxID=1279009 RepID=M7N1X5_9BACT|nr:PAS domain-containing sensor histidine kinase [Cesiribacter andamanensis]EMR01221.1 Sensor protein kinase walK [Cesiribacter andamanensis AMV16]